MDDELGMLDIAKEFFNQYGAHACTASTAIDAMRMAETGKYDLIILDRRLPDGDGNEVLKKIKGMEAAKNTPVIMLTGEKKMTEIKSSIELGAAGYITKPFRPTDFLAQLEKILKEP